MAVKIAWTRKAHFSLEATLEYLQKEWSEKEVVSFVESVNKKLAILQSFPKLGNISSKDKNIYKTIMHKRITLVYQYRPRKKEILLIAFLNNWQDNSKSPY